MKFTAVGDALIQQRIPLDYKGIDELKPYIMQGDVRFFNLETTLGAEGDSFASQFSGGTYLRADPETLNDVKKFGFNITTFNNNHAMDFSYGGLLSTLDCLDKSGLVHAGVGRNLEEASAPCYLETESGRVALISVNTSFDPSMMAGKKSKVYPGRPGINGLRIDRYIQVSNADIEYIRALAKETNVNAAADHDRETGYLLPLGEGVAEFGDIVFRAGDGVGRCEAVCEKDFDRVKQAIKEANLNADYTVISIHSHAMDTSVLELPPRFLVDFAHGCIDSGANAVIGHGPHLLRPIEIYKDSPIFYSLGDFILELYSVPSAPEDFYEKYGLTSESTVYELLKTRSKNFTIGLMEEQRMLNSVIPFWETENKKIKSLTLLPVTIIRNGSESEIGLPLKSKDTAFMEEFARLSAPFGVKMKPSGDGLYTCEW